METGKRHVDARQGPGMLHLQRSLITEVQRLERSAPGAGLAFAFTDHAGKTFLFANKRMPIPENKTQPIEGSETLVTLENGDRYSTIRFMVRNLGPEYGLAERIDLACAAISAIARIDQDGATQQAA